MDNIRPQDMGKPSEQLSKPGEYELMPLPAPYDKPGMEPEFTPADESWKENYCTTLDGFIGNDTLGLDNGLLAREIRKLFSMEMGIAPKPLHEHGTVSQLKTGSSTGLNKAAFLDLIEFLEDDLYERTGKKYKIPINKKGADILLTHNAGEFLAWPENPSDTFKQNK